MQVIQPDWVTYTYKALQLAGFALAVKVILWLKDFRHDVSEMKDNHLTHVQAAVEQTNVKLDSMKDAIVFELRELRADIREKR